MARLAPPASAKKRPLPSLNARTLLALLSLLLAWPAGPAAADVDEALYDLPAIETHLIKSQFMDQTYEIHVMLPLSKTDGSEAFPVLYMTDANGGIPFAHPTRIMQVNEDLPRFIVVGIGYPVKNLFGAMNLRRRDLTPTDASYPEFSLPIAGVEQVHTAKKTGGAPEFLRFIREQLMPFINARYNTVPGDNGYFGHSFGGLFGLYVLFHAPDTFNRYVIGSPALWWDQETIFTDARTFVQSREAVNARVYMAVGGREERHRPDKHWVSNVYRLDALLSSKPLAGFSLQTEVFPRESHISVLGLIHSRGLRAVYEAPACSPFLPEDCGQSAP